MSDDSSHCHHEIHVTVHPRPGATYDDFLDDCARAGVRGHVMTLVPVDGPLVTDWMTGMSINTSDAGAIEALVDTAEELDFMGWDPVRVKIEAAPWHHMSPVLHGTSPMSPHYWESHVGVWVPPGEMEDTAARLEELGCYLSINALKPRRENGDVRASATCRSTAYSRPEQELQALLMRDMLRRMGLDTDTRVRTEFTWLDMAYDTSRYGGPPVVVAA